MLYDKKMSSLKDKILEEANELKKEDKIKKVVSSKKIKVKKYGKKK